ncbi:MAG: InlB B-repeat-containing protein [Lachnospiraceae bacterium]|nr:InlB B-repeat-containing protein [Lachnospiraceae bacterium]
MNKSVRKIKQNSGFTISELLVATLILLLTSAMLVTCIRLGLKQLYQQTEESEAQMLCTMLSTAVQDELTYAGNPQMQDTTAGKLLLFDRDGAPNKVGFYMASNVDSEEPDYVAITDDSDFAKVNLGQISLAAIDSSNNIVSTYGLVSTGAYNIENSKNGSLQAGMQLKEHGSGYEVRISIYNSSGSDKAIATKDFYVGRVTGDVSANMDVDDSGDSITYNLTFDPAGGRFDDNTTASKSYTGLANGSIYDVPNVTRDNYDFAGWRGDDGSTVPVGGSVTVNRDVTYTAQWTGKNYTARFYQDEAKTVDAGAISAIYGRIIGGTVEGQEINWIGKRGVDEYNFSRLNNRTGYVFDGWVDESGNIYYIEAGDTWTVTENQDFVAHYSPVKYTANFYRGYDSHGNPTGLVDTMQVEYDETINLPTAPEPLVAGYTFQGWEYERATDDKVVIPVGDTTFKYEYSRNIDFVATWNYYTLTFYNGNNKVGQALIIFNQSTLDYQYVDNIEQSELNHSDSANWTFNGWYSDPVNGVRDFDENGDPTDANTIIDTFNNGQHNVNLYAGYVNANEMYVKTDSINAVEQKFLIVGGDTLGNNQKAMTHDGGDVETADVTIKGDNNLKYIDYDSSDLSLQWYTSSKEDGRFYIRKYQSVREWIIFTRYKYLDLLRSSSHDLTITTDSNEEYCDCRTWTYSNNELHGYYDTNLGRNWNVYYDTSSKSFKDREETGNGSIHIYQLTGANTVVSFNGYNY